MSWRDVKTAIDVEDGTRRMQAQRAAILARHANNLSIEIAAAGVLDAFDQNRPASFEDVVQIELYARAHG